MKSLGNFLKKQLRHIRRPTSQMATRGYNDGIASADAVPSAASRFLLIRAWGNGFWSDICHVLGSLLLAEISGRIPVTHLGEESRFAVDGNRDAFTAYFEPLSGVTAEDLMRLQGSHFFPAKWTNANLLTPNRPRWCCDDPARLGEQYLPPSRENCRRRLLSRRHRRHAVDP